MHFATLLSALVMLCIVTCNPLPAQNDPTALDDMVLDPTALDDMVTNITTKDIDPPQNVGLYICSEANWTGTCSWAIPEGILDSDSETICHELPYANSIFISFGPDTAIICRVYRGDNCDDTGNLVEYPGWESMPRVEHPLYGIFQTYQCHLKA